MSIVEIKREVSNGDKVKIKNSFSGHIDVLVGRIAEIFKKEL
jgi:hypothetical protein